MLYINWQNNKDGSDNYTLTTPEEPESTIISLGPDAEHLVGPLASFGDIRALTISNDLWYARWFWTDVPESVHINEAGCSVLVFIDPQDIINFDGAVNIFRFANSLTNGPSAGHLSLYKTAADLLGISTSWNSWSSEGEVAVTFPTTAFWVWMRFEPSHATTTERLKYRLWEWDATVPSEWTVVNVTGAAATEGTFNILQEISASQDQEVGTGMAIGPIVISENLDEDMTAYLPQSEEPVVPDIFIDWHGEFVGNDYTLSTPEAPDAIVLTRDGTAIDIVDKPAYGGLRILENTTGAYQDANIMTLPVETQPDHTGFSFLIFVDPGAIENNDFVLYYGDDSLYYLNGRLRVARFNDEVDVRINYGAVSGESNVESRGIPWPTTGFWLWGRVQPNGVTPAERLQFKVWEYGTQIPENFQSTVAVANGVAAAEGDWVNSTRLNFMTRDNFQVIAGVGPFVLSLDPDSDLSSFVGDIQVGIPNITNITPSTVTASNNPVITLTNGGESQGIGSVIISPTDDINDLGGEVQLIASGGWSDTQIVLDGVIFPVGTNDTDTLYVFVTNNGSESNTNGFTITASLLAIVGATDYTPGSASTLTVESLSETPYTVSWSPVNDASDLRTVELTVNNDNLDINGDGTVNVTAVRGDVRYGASGYIIIETASATALRPVTLLVEAGKNYVNLEAPLAPEEERLTAVPDLAAGDQVAWFNVQGGTVADVTVDVDGSFIISAGVTGFDADAHDGYDWGATGTQSTSSTQLTVEIDAAPQVNVTVYDVVIVAPILSAWNSNPLYRGGSLLSNRTNISYVVRENHSLTGAVILNGTNGSTDENGVFSLTNISYTDGSPVTVFLYWEDGGADRSLIVYTTLTPI